jgi:uncharacterized membrane protein
MTIWTFDTVDGAAGAAQVLAGEDAGARWTVLDQVLVRWPADAADPVFAQQARTDHVPRSGWKTFWSDLVGTMFTAPLVMAGGLAWKAFIDEALRSGLDEDQVEELRERMQPGTSALMLVTDGDDPAGDGARLPGWTSTVLSEDTVSRR